MTYKMITDDMIDDMLNDIFVIKLDSYIKCLNGFSES